MFGQPMGVNYKGDNHFRTKLGACVSILMYVLLISNLMSLGEAFLDGSRQNETQQSEKYDRYFAGNMSLPENMFQISIVSFYPPWFSSVGKPRMRLRYTDKDEIDLY